MDYLDDEQAKQEIFRKYKYALKGLRVDLGRADVVEALDQCFDDFETILQAFILWAIYREQEDKKPLQYPSAGLVQALQERWIVKNKNAWTDEILENPRFESPSTTWWKAAEEGLGRDVRGRLIADVVEEAHPYVLFRNGLTLRLAIAMDWDWEKIRDYGERETRPQGTGSLTRMIG
jgi:hypothetical protein